MVGATQLELNNVMYASMENFLDDFNRNFLYIKNETRGSAANPALSRRDNTIHHR